MKLSKSEMQEVCRKVRNLDILDVCEWLEIDIPSNFKIQCPSPKHEDNTPSCVIYDSEHGNRCKCYSCNFKANPLELIMAKRNCNAYQAAEFANRFVKVFPEIQQTPKENFLQFAPWELHCLDLTGSPLEHYSIKIPTQEKSKTEQGFSLPKEEALWLLHDKFLENSIKENVFLEKHRAYVLTIFQEAFTDTIPKYKSPAKKLDTFKSSEDFQKEMKAHETRVASYVLFHTSLNFNSLKQWYLDDNMKLFNAAIKRVGQQRYEALCNKIEMVLEVLDDIEEQSEQEEISHDRESYATVAR